MDKRLRKDLLKALGRLGWSAEDAKERLERALSRLAGKEAEEGKEKRITAEDILREAIRPSSQTEDAA